MKARSAWILLLVVAGCSSSHPLAEDSLVDARADAGLSGADASAPDCGPPLPSVPCRTDEDCGNPYLVCASSGDVTVTVCRDPDQDAGINPACPAFPVLQAAPLCPTMAQVTSPVCDIRYQRPCAVDTDCGPAGFTCTNGQCLSSAAATGKTCASPADCPTGWDCYVQCSCPANPKTCFPPFAVSFGCGFCPSDGGIERRR